MGTTKYLTTPRLLALGDLDARLQHWASTSPALAGAEHIDDLVRRAQGSDPDPGRSSDAVYTALGRLHLQGDQAATSAIIAGMWPTLADCLRRRINTEDDLAHDLIAALIDAIPRTIGRRHMASQLRWAVRAELRRRTTRRPVIERRTQPSEEATEAATLDDLGATAVGCSQPAEHHGIWQLLLDARHHDVLSAGEAELLIDFYGLGLEDPSAKPPTASDLALRYDASPAALRQRASRAIGKIRRAVSTGTLSLHAL